MNHSFVSLVALVLVLAPSVFAVDVGGLRILRSGTESFGRLTVFSLGTTSKIYLLQKDGALFIEGISQSFPTKGLHEMSVTGAPWMKNDIRIDKSVTVARVVAHGGYLDDKIEGASSSEQVRMYGGIGNDTLIGSLYAKIVFFNGGTSNQYGDTHIVPAGAMGFNQAVVSTLDKFTILGEMDYVQTMTTPLFYIYPSSPCGCYSQWLYDLNN